MSGGKERGRCRGGRAWIAVLALGVIFTAQTLSSAVQKSATWDETHYLGVGNYLLEHRQWDIPSALLHPPLSFYLHGLPLLFCDLDPSCFERREPENIRSCIDRGRCLMAHSRPSGDRLLFLARLPGICLGLLLGFFVYRWSALIFGTAGGFVSLFLYTFSPNMLAHARLITPDLALTTFGFLTAFHFFQNGRRPGVRNTVLSGLLLGLTLLTKYSGLLWIPILVLSATLGARFKGERPAAHTDSFHERPLLALGAAVVLGWVVLAAGYGFHVSNYFDGLDLQGRMTQEGFPAFLNGKASARGGWWYYYLVAFLIKVPIPFLLLVVLSVVALSRSRRPERGRILFALFLPVFAFFAVFSCLTRVNVGIRYVLPAFPFLMVMAGGVTALPIKRNLLRVCGTLFLLVWFAYESLSVYPHYLAYFNQIAGGPKNGYLHLVDSNLDWGQDLKGLKAYMVREGIDRVKLSYFGTADPALYGIDYDPLPSFRVPKPPEEGLPLKAGDILAVSATNLYPLYVDLGPLGACLRKSGPRARIGYSIFIYELERPAGATPEP